jgi:hypothetical protein
MSYVILVNDDDTLYGSKKCRIMQRQKLINDIVFIVNPVYRNTHDMTKASVLLEYVLPISRKYETVYLELCEEKYNNCFLQYRLPLDTNITSEHGAVELQLTFAYAEMDANGEIIQRVRKTSTTTIEIMPISNWSDIIPDSALGGLDQRLIVMNAQIQALDDYMNVIDNTQVDNLVYNPTEETLQLSAKGVGVGNKVSVKEMLDDGVPVIDLDNNSNKNHDKEEDDGCNCGCEDNVVEFGDNVTVHPNNNDDNVVEF